MGNGIQHQQFAVLRACPSLTSTSSTMVKCNYKGTSLDNCFNPVDETRVTLSCNTFYEEASVEKNPIRLCKNGKWNPPIPQCYPSCGMKSAKGKPNIINGRNATIGDYPWHIGIYNSHKELICGGSIIDQRAILTAAHCLTDHNGNPYPTTEFFIGAGKYYRNYQDDRDQLAQYSNVLAIHVPEKYKGGVHFYANDIAVVILTNPFTLSEVVLPICIELNEAIHYFDFSLNKNGIVTGWGHTEEGRKLSEVLKELQVPYIPYERCFKEVPENFRSFITSDKVCGGFTNSSKSICGGDSGGGLTLKNVLDNLYYLKGIVSTSPATEELACDSNTYSLYTAVSHHTNFVRDLVQYYQQQQSVECIKEDCSDQETESRNSCLFPNFPPNGKYLLFSQNIIYSPGDYVPLESTLAISCDTGYEVSSSHGSYSYCTDNGQWMPAPGTCESRGVTNYFGTDGPPSYPTTFIPPTTFPVKRVAIVPKQHYSSEECGIAVERTSLVGGESVISTELPWMSIIMYKINGLYTFSCNSVLVSKKHVVTRGACVELNISIEDILVIIGNVDLENWFEDESRVVTSVRQIWVYPDIDGERSDFDIAVFALSNFKSDYVRPICLWNESDNLNLVVNEFGTVAGWGDKRLNTSYTSKPQYTRMPIVSEETCRSSSPGFADDISNIAFCAGKRDGKGPCFGAGGVGFMMIRGGRWTLRGLLSRGILTNDGSCDLYSYFIFADVAKYKRWLNEVIT